MTTRVYKYPIRIQDEITLVLPIGAQPLHVGMQDDNVFLWALVDPMATTESRRFLVRGTGHDINEDVTYVGTFQIKKGTRLEQHGVLTDELVFHVFATGAGT